MWRGLSGSSGRMLDEALRCGCLHRRVTRTLSDATGLETVPTESARGIPRPRMQNSDVFRTIPGRLSAEVFPRWGPGPEGCPHRRPPARRTEGIPASERRFQSGSDRPDPVDYGIDLLMREVGVQEGELQHYPAVLDRLADDRPLR